MAVYPVICVLLLLSSLGCEAQQSDDPDIELDSVLQTELDVLVDGRKVHETSMTDKDCHAQLLTATFDDNTTNTIINDLDQRKSLVLFSETPDVCYVRTLTKKKSNCKNGYEITDKNEVSSTVVTNYKLGAQLNTSDLPAAFQGMCENRTVTQLVEDTDDTGTSTPQPASTPIAGVLGLRRKRALEYLCTLHNVIKCRMVTECNHCCNGWWGGRRCGNNCCRTYQSCKPEYERKCVWVQSSGSSGSVPWWGSFFPG